MADQSFRLSFVDDTRGVAPLVGFILLFGFLVIALTGYQATIVPQQNAETEFEHFENVRNEMIELRNAISTAGQAGVSQFPSVKLGTNYQNRFLTVNPPPPSGTLQTSAAYNITISNGTELYDKNVSTRFIRYQPNYYEIRIGSTWYEHSVVYLDDRDLGSGLSIIEDQNIVKGGAVRITALQNSFQETRTGRVTVELYPQEQLAADELPEGENLTVTVPTRLNGDDYWDSALDGSGDIYQGVDSEAHGDDVHALNLSVDSDDLRVNTVGIRTDPNENPVTNVDRSTGNGIDDEIRVFNTDDTWDVPNGVDEVEVLVVAGGGSGGSVEDFNTAGGGGGGAGGVVHETSYSVTPGDTITVEVGAGGTAPSGDTPGDDGENSRFDSLEAIGGGGGATDANQEGRDGGSGGGARSEDGTRSGGQAQQPGSASGGFGNDGGDGVDGSAGNSQGAGGGGGAGEAGSPNSDENGGDGGDGKYFGDRFGDDIGVNGWVAGGGGGGGGTESSTAGSGGQGGGGDGSVTGGDPAGAGELNTGSGGGGGGSSSVSATSPGDGGSGVVVIRWTP